MVRHADQADLRREAEVVLLGANGGRLTVVQLRDADPEVQVLHDLAAEVEREADAPSKSAGFLGSAGFNGLGLATNPLDLEDRQVQLVQSLEHSP